ncbi:polysaccharide biosynthesis/export family protein [Leptothermofonsia sp. ETS-13]|uniref:polysaccharide biosynthesis/export family protein n=1 Tax=Leptothermofonsia sp. ETS-13 TaxID=3035696 RepID=UPI003B9EE06C
MLARRFTISMLLVAMASSGVAFPGWTLPLSPGDRVRLFTPLDDELPSNSPFRLSGLYEVNLDGTLQVPFLEPQPAAGLEVAQVEKNLVDALIKKGYFRQEFLELSVKVAHWAPVYVTVSGEAFRPGRVLINAAVSGERDGASQPVIEEAIAGNYPPERYLTAAIRQAGGLKPTADIRQIRLIRGKQEKVFDLSGVITGQSVPDVPLIAGDQVVIPRVAIAQKELVRPSQLTPTEIPVLLSNLTAPHTPNQGKGGQILNLEYGTRLSQVVVAAGCAGGTRSTNARRKVALVRTNRLTGETNVIDRPVERLLNNASNDKENPFLMPQDGVVCYDSKVTNIASILRTVGTIFSPFFLIPGLFRHDE